jgi:glucose-6-phosphate 1-dehydrogenase
MPNRLRLRLSPDVVIALDMRVKVRGEPMEGEDVELIATHQHADEMTPYERLLRDALCGDPSLFAREDAFEGQWKIVEPVLGDVTPVYEYEQNTWGPAEAGSMIEDPGGWLNPEPIGLASGPPVAGQPLPTTDSREGHFGYSD